MRTDDDTTLAHRSKSFGLTHGNPKYQLHVQRSHLQVAFRRSLNFLKTSFIMDALTSRLHLSLSKVWMNTMCYIDSYHTLSI